MRSFRRVGASIYPARGVASPSALLITGPNARIPGLWAGFALRRAKCPGIRAEETGQRTSPAPSGGRRLPALVTAAARAIATLGAVEWRTQFSVAGLAVRGGVPARHPATAARADADGLLLVVDGVRAPALIAAAAVVAVAVHGPVLPGLALGMQQRVAVPVPVVVVRLAVGTAVILALTALDRADSGHRRHPTSIYRGSILGKTRFQAA